MSSTRCIARAHRCAAGAGAADAAAAAAAEHPSDGNCLVGPPRCGHAEESGEGRGGLRQGGGGGGGACSGTRPVAGGGGGGGGTTIAGWVRLATVMQAQEKGRPGGRGRRGGGGGHPSCWWGCPERQRGLRCSCPTPPPIRPPGCRSSPAAAPAAAAEAGGSRHAPSPGPPFHSRGRAALWQLTLSDTPFPDPPLPCRTVPDPGWHPEGTLGCGDSCGHVRQSWHSEGATGWAGRQTPGMERCATRATWHTARCPHPACCGAVLMRE